MKGAPQAVVGAQIPQGPVGCFPPAPMVLYWLGLLPKILVDPRFRLGEPLFHTTQESSVTTGRLYTKGKCNLSVILEIETALTVWGHVTYSLKILNRSGWGQVPNASCNFIFLELLLAFCSLWSLIKEG